MSSRRNISVFNMSFLDLITNYLGATTILLLVAMKHYQERPSPTIHRQMQVSYDATQHKIHGDVTTHVEGVKEGDSILVVVRDLRELPTGGGPTEGSGGTPAPPAPPGKCGIYPIVQDQQCNAAGDRFTIDLKVEKSGSCASNSWRTSDGSTGRYGESVTLGPFAVREGARTITVYDARNADLTYEVPVAPNCGSSPTPPVACQIVLSAQNKKCSDGGTPQDLSDDTFTFDLLVEAAGSCATTWSAGGKTGRYGVAMPLGPYRIGQGVQKLTVVDAQNPAVSKIIQVEPPSACSSAPPPPPNLPGEINFYISWGDKAERVDLYVQKGSKWVYDDHKNEPAIGRWDNLRAGVFDRTDCELVRQDGVIPGIYKIYAHYKGRREGADKAAVPVSLWVTSKLKSGTSQHPASISVPFTRRSPKQGGGKLLLTVEVMADGSLKVR